MIEASEDWIRALSGRHADVEFQQPASTTLIEEAEQVVGKLPDELAALLRRTNGLVCRSFRIYSAYDPGRPKKTWESLQRANDPQYEIALGGDQSLHARFLIFSDIGNGHAMFDRNDWSIWFEEEGVEELRQTDLKLREFVELMVEKAE